MSPPPGLRWPDPWPASGPVVLRPWREDDLPAVTELASDPYVPLTGSLPFRCTAAEGRAYIARQHQRLADGTGWSFAVAEQGSDRAVGGAGLWLHGDGPATGGYAIVPSRRGAGLATAALRALTGFAWTVAVPAVDLLVEPGNLGSRTVAERAGYRLVAQLARHTEIGGRRRDVCRYRLERPGGAVAPPGSADPGV